MVSRKELTRARVFLNLNVCRTKRYDMEPQTRSSTDEVLVKPIASTLMPNFRLGKYAFSKCLFPYIFEVNFVVTNPLGANAALKLMCEPNFLALTSGSFRGSGNCPGFWQVFVSLCVSLRIFLEQPLSLSLTHTRALAFCCADGEMHGEPRWSWWCLLARLRKP